MAATNRSGGDGNAHKALLRHCLDWLTQTWASRPYNNVTSDNDEVQYGINFLTQLAQNEEAKALRAQAELSAYLKWLKVFSEALLPTEESQTQNDEGTEEVENG